MVIPAFLPCPAWSPQRGLLPAAAAPMGQAGVQCPTALLETVSVLRLPDTTHGTPRGYPTTHQGLKNTCAVFLPMLCQLEWGDWSKPKDLPLGHHRCPISSGNRRAPLTLSTAS